jgi:hypothetical protein
MTANPDNKNKYWAVGESEFDENQHQTVRRLHLDIVIVIKARVAWLRAWGPRDDDFSKKP